MPPDDFSMFELPNQPDDERRPEPEAKPTSGQVVMSDEQFDRLLKAQNESQEARWSQLLQGVTPRVQDTPRAAPEISIDLEGLPDPRMDLEGYHKGLGERLGKTVQAIRTYATEEASQEYQSKARIDNLTNDAWARIQKANPELTEVPELASSIAAQVYQELRNKGMDPMRALETDMDAVVDQISKRADNLFARVRGEQVVDRNATDGRTSVIGGGSNRGGGRKTAPKPQDDYRPDDFITSLKKAQHDLKIY